MANGGADESLIHLIHTLWSGALTLLVASIGWLLRWNWNKINKEVDLLKQEMDGKVDKIDLKEVADQLREGQKEIMRIIERNNESAKQDRHDLRNLLTPVVTDVAFLKGKLLKDGD